MGTSSDDGFSTAMPIAPVLEIEGHLPRVRSQQEAIAAKAAQWHVMVKIGTT